MNAYSRSAFLLLLPGLIAGCSASRIAAPANPTCVGETVCEVGRPPEPEGLSDIARIGGNRYWSVDDRGGRLHELEIAIDGTGVVGSCRVVRSVALKGRRDLEGCAADPLDGRVWVSDESDSSVRQFDPQTGVETAQTAVPDVFRTQAVANRSFEALAISPDGRTMYVANEDTLKCDGPVADRERGGLVRILELTRADGSAPWKAARQFRYRTEAVAGDPYRGLEISGVAAMAAAEDGGLYVLEREFSKKNPLFPTFRAGLFEVRPEGPDGTLLEKRTVWSEDTAFANYEGLCFGPKLEDGSPSLILISDGGGPAVETVRVLALRADGPTSRKSP